MSRSVLITGGAGFIGSHVADDLLARGYRVRALDALVPQVHGSARRRPAHLAPEVELIVGDVRDPQAVRHALADVDVVCHLAARVGVGQSTYELAEYTSVNNLGTAVLLEAMIDRAAIRPVERLVLASSMRIYGEGLYRDAQGHLHERVMRTAEQLTRADWEPRTADGRALTSAPTPESKPPTLASVYALSKYDQERMCLLMGAAYRIPTVVLRLFNVYGPRQAPSNPYTGVLARFAARLLAGSPPVVFEDGQQQRDFVHVRDVARACRLALEVDTAGGAFNIGGGHALTIRAIAERMAATLGEALPPQITGQFRVGDIRHCTADIGAARRVLGYAPQVPFDVGLRELVACRASRAERTHRELAV